MLITYKQDCTFTRQNTATDNRIKAEYACMKSRYSPQNEKTTTHALANCNLSLHEIKPLITLRSLRFRRGELKVTFTRPLQLKGYLYER